MSSVKWSDLPDSTPLDYEQENQKRPGSKSHALYEKYKKSKTYGEAKANGARPEDFRHDYGKGWLKLQPADGQLPLVPPKNGAKKESEGSKRPSKDGGSKKSKEEDEPIWQEETRDPEQIQQDLKKQEQLSKELNELKNDQYKKRERPKDAFEMAMEAFSKGSSKSSKQIKVSEGESKGAAFDVKLEKAHKQLQKETMEQLEKARKERAEKAAREAREEAKVKTERSSRAKVPPEKTPEKPEKIEKTSKPIEKTKIEKAEKAEAKAEKKEKVEVKSEKSDKVKHDKSDKEKKLKKDKKEKKHKKDKKHKKHKRREHKKSETQGTKKPPRLSASRIRELLRSKVKNFAGGKHAYRKDEQGLFIRLDSNRKRECTSVYMGVSPAPGQNKDGSRPAWRARYEGTTLGTFDTEEEAAQAYAKARAEHEKNGGSPGSNGVKRPSPPPQEKEASPNKEPDKIPDSLQATVEVLQRQINELKPQQLDKLIEYFKADITWRADDAEDFNFDLKTYSVPRLRELTRLIRQVRAEAANTLDANERLRLQQSKPAVSQSAQLAAMNPQNERELQDKIRELEQKNQNQQRQIEEQKVQMMQMQVQAVQAAQAQVQVQDPRFPPGQNSFGGSSSSTRPNETWKVAQEAMSQALHGSHPASLPPGGRWPAGYIGDGGGWVPGGEPPKNAQPPAIPPGDTEPPGRCVETCRCGQVVSRAWEVEKPWLKDEARAMAIMAAIHRFESQPSVERRGKVSKQNRYEPAAPTQQALAAEVASRVPLPAHLRMRAP